VAERSVRRCAAVFTLREGCCLQREDCRRDVHQHQPQRSPGSLATKEHQLASISSFRFLGAVAAPVKAFARSSPRLNAALWDVQYKLGLWDYLDAGDAAGRELADLINEYMPKASILDLGCGTSANLPLEPGTYQDYHGVDISAKAIKRAGQLGRPQATYETADILSYAPSKKYDAILLREVIYYLPPGQVSEFLARLSGFLAPGGIILIQVWEGEKSPGLIAAIKDSDVPVTLEKALEQDPGHPTVYLLGGQP
jgi:SAM-dependent methyltransferase